MCLRLPTWFFLILFSFPLYGQNSHGHQGKLKAYEGEPPAIDISETEKQILASGRPVFKKLDLKESGRGIAIFRVNANVETIWSIINDFKSYPQWIKDIDETEVYDESNGLVRVRFLAKGWLSGETSWHVVHDYPRRQDNINRDWGSWKLDYNYLSDIDDSVGFWRVIPVVGKEAMSDVIYSADLKLKGFFGSLFQKKIIKNSLKDATKWVKVQAESLAQNQ